ncbi:hypothetical protein [Granulicella sp. S190]|uniref:hypothetical protein n=1 Tax=Granulicella sp. S190 TaxID=1747226 RepID=UPI0020B16AA9|nr:hypothetical protein [Granulicella sp. S190]
MSQVLVVFQANTERTEQLALAVGVGAVESEASIRLRRLAMADSVEVGHKGYGTLKEADLLWADTVVVGLEDERPETEELNELLALLGTLKPETMKGKRAWTFGAEGDTPQKSAAQRVVEDALVGAGITLPPLAILSAGDATGRMKEAGQQMGKKRV